ncbi:MAG: prepilin-type N-terminal cleavage/methylation domain-containing protein [Nitrosomonadales bacterium]|nr:prepilin-type N-terminal cleavage/methylation domain-containing protein [Nitrosomonadales bacterium]
MKHKQSGFTLIEIAIVLVIIGLLLGGVLKGQELINSAKVKNLAADFKNIPVFIYGYQDKFKALPGDQTQAKLDAQFPPANTGTVCTPAAAGLCATGNGVIDGAWNATTVASESFVFWQHVRLAGLAPGATATASADYLPVNAAGGTIGIQSGTTDVTKTPIKDLSGTPVAIRGSYIICSKGILGKFAKQLDTTMDDGNTATGSMMSALETGYAIGDDAVATIDDALTYTVCMGI